VQDIKECYSEDERSRQRHVYHLVLQRKAAKSKEGMPCEAFKGYGIVTSHLIASSIINVNRVIEKIMEQQTRAPAEEAAQQARAAAEIL